MTDTPKLHYYLIAGIVLFKDESTGTDAIGRIEINAINKDVQKNVGVQQVQDMQRALQMTTFQRFGGPVEVVGVTILTMNYLGEMSDEEFNNAPLEEEARLAAAEAAKAKAH